MINIYWTAILEILVIPLSFEDKYILILKKNILINNIKSPKILTLRFFFPSVYIKIQSPWPIGVPRDYFMVDRF